MLKKQDTLTNADSNKKPNPNTIVVTFVLAVIVALLSHLIPAGQFAREIVDGRPLVIPGSFQFIEAPAGQI